MAVFTQKRVEGQLPSTKGTLYTTPASTSSMLKVITLVNTSGSAVTINLYLKNATSRRIIPLNYSLAAGAQALLEFSDHALLTGDLIEGDASSATTVDYWITLIEIT
jgi:hypothetical protein